MLALACLVSVAPLYAVTPADVSFAATTAHSDRAVTLQAQLYKPEGDGPFPAVVLMHGCGGLSPAARDALQAHSEFLVRNGYVALALDSFGPRGYADGWVCETFDRLMHARRYRSADALDALHYLRSLDFVDRENVFQIGQSNGASVSIVLAQMEKPAFRALVAFYPWCGAFKRLGNKAVIRSPLLVLGGALDDWTPPGDCQSVEPGGAEYRVVVYPDAVHSFDLGISRQQYQGHQVGYDQWATIDSRNQILAFFDAHSSAERKARMPQ
jgi:dienelactone hydrolase